MAHGQTIPIKTGIKTAIKEMISVRFMAVKMVHPTQVKVKNRNSAEAIWRILTTERLKTERHL